MSDFVLNDTDSEVDSDEEVSYFDSICKVDSGKRNI